VREKGIIEIKIREQKRMTISLSTKRALFAFKLWPKEEAPRRRIQQEIFKRQKSVERKKERERERTKELQIHAMSEWPRNKHEVNDVRK